MGVGKIAWHRYQYRAEPRSFAHVMRPTPHGPDQRAGRFISFQSIVPLPSVRSASRSILSRKRVGLRSPEAKSGSKLVYLRLGAHASPQIAPRAFRRGTLESIISPVNGRLSSSTRKIAEAAENANTDRQAKSVALRGENRL